ncbi:MAG: MBL fold metallo-hydrolase [Pseudomonadota bacterium]|nr:MBL fold metallo-hydrolase [Pseudomonadota bacterium]
MEKLYPDLWQTRAEQPAPGLITHAYLLTRDEGNVLLYNSSHEDEWLDMARLGGVRYQWLSHQDEVGDSLAALQQRFGCALSIHQAERAEAERFAPVAHAFAEEPERQLGIQILPAPGHTRGSVCFFYASPYGRRYLFTGDTLLMDNDRRWRSGYLPGISDRASLAASLRLLATLAPDVVISSATYGAYPWVEIAPGDWPAAVEQALGALG